MITDDLLGYVPGTIEEIYMVSMAFEHWQLSRNALRSLETRSNINETFGVQISQYPIAPEHILEFQLKVVETYHEWFQYVLLAQQSYYKEKGGRVEYYVYARWNILNQTVVSDDEQVIIYHAPIIFDEKKQTSRKEAEDHLMIVLINQEVFKMYPVPVDFVNRVEARATVPPDFRD